MFLQACKTTFSTLNWARSIIMARVCVCVKELKAIMAINFMPDSSSYVTSLGSCIMYCAIPDREGRHVISDIDWDIHPTQPPHSPRGAFFVSYFISITISSIACTLQISSIKDCGEGEGVCKSLHFLVAMVMTSQRESFYSSGGLSL